MMSFSRRVVASVLVGVLSFSTGSTAFASPERETSPVKGKRLDYPKSKAARAHFDAGVTHYNLRAFDKAIDEFKAGAAIEPAPILFFNLGQAFQQAGDLEQAAWFFRRTLSAFKPTPPPEWLQQIVDKKLVAVEEARAAAERANAEAERKRVPDQPEPQPPRDHELAGAPAVPAVPPRTSIPHREGRGRRVLGWSLVGVGIVAGGAAGLAGWSSIDLDRQADGTRRASEREALYSSSDTRGTLAVVGGVVAGAALATGVVLLVKGRGTDAEPVPVAVRFDERSAAVSAVFDF